MNEVTDFTGLDGASIKEGDVLEVTIDGTVNEYTVKTGGNQLFFGDDASWESHGTDGDFYCSADITGGTVDGCVLGFAEDGEHTIRIRRKTVSKVQKEFLPKDIFYTSDVVTVVIDEDCDFQPSGYVDQTES